MANRLGLKRLCCSGLIIFLVGCGSGTTSPNQATSAVTASSSSHVVDNSGASPTPTPTPTTTPVSLPKLPQHGNPSATPTATPTPTPTATPTPTPTPTPSTASGSGNGSDAVETVYLYHNSSGYFGTTDPNVPAADGTYLGPYFNAYATQSSSHALVIVNCVWGPGYLALDVATNAEVCARFGGSVAQVVGFASAAPVSGGVRYILWNLIGTNIYVVATDAQSTNLSNAGWQPVGIVGYGP